MFINRLPKFVSALKAKRGGFTLVELLVVIGIIAILAGVALGPITNGIEKAKENAGMQNARSINSLLFQYSTDHDNVYPTGNASADIAIILLQNKYASDPTIFTLGSQTKFTGTDPTTFASANISWDFTGGPSNTGVTSSASDLLPLVFTTGDSGVIYPTSPGTPVNVLQTGSGPFKNNGMAVAYKGNNAVFIKSTLSGTSAYVNNFISPSYNDATQYVWIKSGN